MRGRRVDVAVVQDETSIQHAEVTRPEPTISESVPEPTELLARSTERYVPESVRCANCGCSGSAFEWPQRIEAGVVDDGVPERTQHFCGIVCLGAYVTNRFESWSPTTEPLRRQSTASQR